MNKRWVYRTPRIANLMDDRITNEFCFLRFMAFVRTSIFYAASHGEIFGTLRVASLISFTFFFLRRCVYYWWSARIFFVNGRRLQYRSFISRWVQFVSNIVINHTNDGWSVVSGERPRCVWMSVRLENKSSALPQLGIEECALISRKSFACELAKLKVSRCD